MTAAPVTAAPAAVRLFNPIVRLMLRLGVPLGPNAMLTVRGRRSGQPRSAPIAILEIGPRRWAVSTFGDVQWVRNLRVAGEAEIHGRSGTRHVVATELDRRDAVTFFRLTLPAYVAHLPWFGRLFAAGFFRLVAPEILADPERAAGSHPVFGLVEA